MAKQQKDTENSLAIALSNFDRGLSLANIQTFIDSGAIPVDTIETAITIATMGKEIGIATMTALNNISIIKGRTVISAALLGSLLKTNGYEFLWPKNWVKETINTTEQIVTEITLYWHSKLEHPLTRSHTWSESFSVTWAEMENAGYTTKENWEKYPKNMLRARCMAYAVRAIAPQILMGMYTDLEIIDALDAGKEFTTTFTDEGDSIVSPIDVTNFTEFDEQ